MNKAMDDSGSSNNSHLQRVLKSYKHSADRSLSGPRDLNLPIDLSLVSATESETTTVQQSLSGQFPVFMPTDTTTTEQTETRLEGENIACFNIGGENRLCMPQILNNVLRDVTLQEMNAACDSLRIFCTRCSDAQLFTLKNSGVLPAGAPTCGLITKTDAERLCSALLSSTEDICSAPSPHSFRVYHYCFGKGEGDLDPDLYTAPDAKCILCVQCRRLFSTMKFVCHSHRAPENRTCHWGFDSERWREYLMVKDRKFRGILERIKDKFATKQNHKRRQSGETSTENLEQKRVKTDLVPSDKTTPLKTSWTTKPDITTPTKTGKLLERLIKEGVPPETSRSEPLLVKTDRVISFSESVRYDRHYVPNVSLAPPTKPHVTCETTNQKTAADVAMEISKNQSKVSFHQSRNVKDTNGEMIVITPSSCGKLTSSNDVSGKSGSRLLIDGDDKSCDTDSPTFDRCLEQELTMIHLALDQKVSQADEGRRSFLQQFCRLRTRQDQHAFTLCCQKRALMQELQEAKKEQQQKTDDLEILQTRLSNLRLDCKQREETAQRETDSLRDKLSALDHSLALKALNNARSESDSKTRLTFLRNLCHELEQDNDILRSELATHDVDMAKTLNNKSPENARKLTNEREEKKVLNCRESLSVEVKGEEEDRVISPSPLLLKSMTPCRRPKILPPKKARELMMG